VGVCCSVPLALLHISHSLLIIFAQGGQMSHTVRFLRYDSCSRQVNLLSGTLGSLGRKSWVCLVVSLRRRLKGERGYDWDKSLCYDSAVLTAKLKILISWRLSRGGSRLSFPIWQHTRATFPYPLVAMGKTNSYHNCLFSLAKPLRDTCPS
jgi:hypothetical protein